MLAVGCYEAMEEAGLSCPGDVSVVGFNDMPFIDRLRPPLTTVAFPHYQLGTEAAAMLLARLSGTGRAGRAAPAVRLAPDLVVRGSVGAAAALAPCGSGAAWRGQRAPARPRSAG